MVPGKKKKMQNEPKNPTWRYQKRGFARKTNPNEPNFWPAHARSLTVAARITVAVRIVSSLLRVPTSCHKIPLREKMKFPNKPILKYHTSPIPHFWLRNAVFGNNDLKTDLKRTPKEPIYGERPRRIPTRRDGSDQRCRIAWSRSLTVAVRIGIAGSCRRR